MRNAELAYETALVINSGIKHYAMLHSDTASACTQLHDLHCQLSICLELPCFTVCLTTFKQSTFTTSTFHVCHRAANAADILIATLLCERGTAAYSMMHAYPCAWSPLAIPDANLAI